MQFICRKCEKVTSGDMHRTGRHGITDGPDERRCLTPVEMLQRGMTTDQRGFWATGRRWHGPVSPAGGDSTASQPPLGGWAYPRP